MYIYIYMTLKYRYIYTFSKLEIKWEKCNWKEVK